MLVASRAGEFEFTHIFSVHRTSGRKVRRGDNAPASFVLLRLANPFSGKIASRNAQRQKA
jgi:hypothetical protein